MEKFSSRLKELRNSLSYKAFEKETGIPAATIERLEKVGKDAKSGQIEKICTAFGVSADWFLGLSDSRSGLNPAKTAPSCASAVKGVNLPASADKDAIIAQLVASNAQLVATVDRQSAEITRLSALIEKSRPQESIADILGEESSKKSKGEVG